MEETSSQRPVFIRPLQDLGELQEGRNAHFEAQLTPVSDPTMKVEWYKDGKPITASEYRHLERSTIIMELLKIKFNKKHYNIKIYIITFLILLYFVLLGSRITSIFNFGYVSLNIMHLRVEDAGSYTVRAVNRLGEAISSATLRVFGEF